MVQVKPNSLLADVNFTGYDLVGLQSPIDGFPIRVGLDQIRFPFRSSKVCFLYHDIAASINRQF